MRGHVVNFLDSRLPERFWEKCIPEPNSGCWLWIGAPKNDLGYGSFWFNNKTTAAHRVSFTALIGEVPAGLQLDHLCRTPQCVNPAHLEAVTQYVNMMRGYGWGAVSARATHCPMGHAYNGENLFISKQGGRVCRTCTRAGNAEREAKLKAAGLCTKSGAHGKSVEWDRCASCLEKVKEYKRRAWAAEKARRAA
jgi:hypothetical protein